MGTNEVHAPTLAARPPQRVFGYCRVSSLEQAKEGHTSLDEQRRKIRAMAATLGVREPEIWSDEGVSGSIRLSERPQGSRLFATLKRGDIIIAAKLDRLFRNIADAAGTVEAFSHAGVGLFLLDLSNKSISSGSSMAQIQFNLLAVFADFERERIRERSAEAKEALRRDGYYPGGTPPFGYRVVIEGRRRRLIPDDGEQAVKRAACLAWDQGKPMRQILRELLAAGHRNRTGQPIRPAEIYRWAVWSSADRVNISERTKAAHARRKARGEKVGNPRMHEISAQGLAEILANTARRANEVKPHIEGAIKGGAATYRKVAFVLNGLTVPTARGGRWHGSSVRNAMLAANIKFPSKSERASQGLPHALKSRGVTARAAERLEAEAREVQVALVKPRLGKAQREAPKILRLHGEGFSRGGIARMLDLHEHTVGTILRAAGRGRARRHSLSQQVEQRTARILEARLRGLNARQIASELDLAEHVVYEALARARLVDPQYGLGRSHLTPDELDRIAELRRQGTPVPEIAQQLRRSKRTVYRAVAYVEPPDTADAMIDP